MCWTSDCEARDACWAAECERAAEDSPSEDEDEDDDETRPTLELAANDENGNGGGDEDDEDAEDDETDDADEEAALMLADGPNTSDSADCQAAGNGDAGMCATARANLLASECE